MYPSHIVFYFLNDCCTSISISCINVSTSWLRNILNQRNKGLMQEKERTSHPYSCHPNEKITIEGQQERTSLTKQLEQDNEKYPFSMLTLNSLHQEHVAHEIKY